MLYYIYDGSFDGLLTAIHEAYYRREQPNRITSEADIQQSFMISKVYIHTDNEKARKVYNSIQSKISAQALENVFYAFLSEVDDSSTAIYQYLRLGWKIGKDIDSHLSNDAVLKVHSICRKVRRENHAMLGLIRFRRLENDIYYSQIEPEYNIIGLAAPHFASRLSNENWVIHDLKRGIAAMYNKNEWIIKDVDTVDELKFEEDEEMYQQLWKEYFKSIAIKNRINPKLQKKNMPIRYWKYLIEKQL
ncbi:TIGR03915 family putative DNA repair protein [Brassicibacter mesophilus]|uniref:TIGR03915 family putative DNA repair protein n=1 Tax=Brassicibacter mesophilus TaxID=745119 RepID=UPI003D19EE15